MFNTSPSGFCGGRKNKKKLKFDLKGIKTFVKVHLTIITHDRITQGNEAREKKNCENVNAVENSHQEGEIDKEVKPK